MVQTIHLCVTINNEESGLGFYDGKTPATLYACGVFVYCIVYIWMDNHLCMLLGNSM